MKALKILIIGIYLIPFSLWALEKNFESVRSNLYHAKNHADRLEMEIIKFNKDITEYNRQSDLQNRLEEEKIKRLQFVKYYNENCEVLSTNSQIKDCNKKAKLALSYFPAKKYPEWHKAFRTLAIITKVVLENRACKIHPLSSLSKAIKLDAKIEALLASGNKFHAQYLLDGFEESLRDSETCMARHDSALSKVSSIKKKISLVKFEDVKKRVCLDNQNKKVKHICSKKLKEDQFYRELNFISYGVESEN